MTASDEHLNRRLAKTPLAIVGVSSLFPGSTNVQEFWNNIVDKVDSVGDVPSTHWDIDEYYSPDKTAPDKTYVRKGGFIDPVPFRPLEFGIPPTQLEVTDVLQLLSLHVTRELLHDAQSEGQWYDPKRTGVILGVTGANQLTQPLSARLQTPALKRAATSMGLSDADADELATRFAAAFAPWEENSFPGMLGNVVSGRVANRFDLGGINMTVDAACASSLAALRAAAAELVDGRVDTMITGGCDDENTIFMYLCFSKTPAFSPTEFITPFDTGADGTLIGEGIGMLALRRLEDAERDGNKIYATIRGIGSSSDGRGMAIYAPAADGQKLAIERAYEDAGISPASIGLVEAHGTVTAVGDNIELTALSQVLNDAGTAEHQVAIGSVKSQIGHTKAAAGAAGLLKLAMAVHHRVLPPTINVTQPADIFSSGPLHVSAEPRPWIRGENQPPRRAGLSSFGFGGTDFHVVVEEYPQSRQLGTLSTGPEVRVWNAPDVDQLITELSDNPAGLSDAGAGLEGPRLAIVAQSEEEFATARESAAEKLRGGSIEAWEDPRGIYFRPEAVAGSTGLLFAGHGSQYPNLGLTAVLSEPLLGDAFDAAASTENLEKLGRIAFPPPRFSDEDRDADAAALRATSMAQPAIGALSVGHVDVLHALGLKAEGLAGHSFGELTALYAAGSLSKEDFFRLAAARGATMEDAAREFGDPGRMVAIIASEDDTKQLIEGIDDAQICNYNGPKQHVIGGTSEAIDQVVSRAQDAGVRAVELDVAAAFHTPIVAGASEEFGKAVQGATVGKPGATVYANTAGKSYGDDTAANAEVLTHQLSHPVAFTQFVEAMYDDGVRIFVECGPGHTLKKMVSSIVDGAGDDVLVVSLDGGPKKDSRTAMAQAIAQLAVAGAVNAWVSPSRADYSPAPEGKGPAVMLNGINYVADSTRKEYEELLATPYQLEAAQAAAPTAPVAQPAPPAPATPAPASTPTPEKDNPVTEPTASNFASAFSAANQQWEVHNIYIETQGRVSHELLKLLQSPDAAHLNIAALEQIVRQTTAVGDTHAEVNRLIAGAPTSSAPTPRATTPARPAEVSRPATPAPQQALPQAAAPSTPEPAQAPQAQQPAETAQPAQPAPAAEAPAAAPTASVDQVVMQAIADSTGYTTDLLDGDMDIEADLGIDSIKRVEIMGAIADEFPGCEPFSPEEVAEIHTIGELSQAMDSRQPEGAQPATEAPAAPAAEPAAAPETPAAAPAQEASGEVDWKSIDDIVLKAIADSTGYTTDLLTKDMDIEADLGIDSIKRVEIMGAIADEFPGREPFSPEEVAEIHTIGDLTAAMGSAPQSSAREHNAQPSSSSEGDAKDEDSDIGRAPFTWTKISHAPRPLAPRKGSVRVVGDSDYASRIADELGAAQGEAGDNLVIVLDPEATGTDALASAIVEVGALAAQPTGAVVLVGVVDNSGYSADAVAPAGVAGIVRTLRVEHPEIPARAVIVEKSSFDAAAVAAEFHDPTVGIDTVLHRDGQRFMLAAEQNPALPTGTSRWSELTAEDTVIVSGGGRGITADCVLALAEVNPSPRYVLLGRSELIDEPAWARGITDEMELRKAAGPALKAQGDKPTPKLVRSTVSQVLNSRDINATLEHFAALDARATYVSVDLKDADAVTRTLSEYADSVAALIHGAGAIDDGMIINKTHEAAERVIRTKITGAENLLSVPAIREQVKHVALFGSAAGLFGNIGQVDYAAGNTVLEYWAGVLSAQLPSAHVVAFDWGAWDGGMVSDTVREIFASRGYELLPIDAGTRMFVEQFDAGLGTQTQVLAGPLKPLSTADAPAEPVRLAAEVAEFMDSELVDEHQINGTPVLPLTASLGMLNAAATATSGNARPTLGKVRVAAGITGKDQPESWSLTASAESATVFSTGDGLRGSDRPRVEAHVVDAPDRDHDFSWVEVETRASESTSVDTGPLFHGPQLLGIEGEAREGDDVIVAGTRPAASYPEHAVGAAFDVVAMDVILQAALVAAHSRFGVHTLPSSIGEATSYARVAPGQRLAVRLSDIQRTAHGVTMNAVAATEVDGQWQVFAELNEIALTERPDEEASH